MGVGSGEQGGAVAPLDFIYGTDKVEGGLMVLFFGPVFPVGPPWKFFCRCSWFTASLLDVQHKKMEVWR